MIRRQTKPIFSSEQKMLIIMEGIRGELSIAELCRKYGISGALFAGIGDKDRISSELEYCIAECLTIYVNQKAIIQPLELYYSVENSETVVKYSRINDNPQMFATKFMSYLPTEEELIAEIDRNKIESPSIH